MRASARARIWVCECVSISRLSSLKRLIYYMHNAQYTRCCHLPICFRLSTVLVRFLLLFFLIHVLFFDSVWFQFVSTAFFVPMSAVCVNTQHISYFHSIFNYCDAFCVCVNWTQKMFSYGFLFDIFCENWRDIQTSNAAKPNIKESQEVCTMHADINCPMAKVVATTAQ